MSSIYIHEPQCTGKVLLETTVGDIDIELWSREAPKACRNIVQLCMEGYYNGTIFHRVIKGFIAQGGDPKGDGTGGESIYGKPFRDEFHSRLRFVRRGLVAMANAEKHDNGSQFFFTLGPCPELQNKHTIFGKVTGDTLFNMLKLEECVVDANDKPMYPHKILGTKVLLNPFPDIIPRNNDDTKNSDIDVKPKEKSKKNFKLLSFGEEAEEEELEVSCVAEKYRGKSKSSHDLANDPKLSSVSVVSLYQNDVNQSSEKLESIRKKLKVEPVKETAPTTDDSSHTTTKIGIEEKIRKQIQDEIKELRKVLKRRKATANEAKQEEAKEEEEKMKSLENPLLEDFHYQSAMARMKNKGSLSNPRERDKQTLEILAKFTNKLKKANEAADEGAKDDEETIRNKWLTHELKCDETTTAAKDANLPSEDRYEITDPRNPINMRRRYENKKKRGHK